MPTATCVKGLPPSPVDVMRDVKTDQSLVFLQKRENARAEAKAPQAGLPGDPTRRGLT